MTPGPDRPDEGPLEQWRLGPGGPPEERVVATPYRPERKRPEKKMPRPEPGHVPT